MKERERQIQPHWFFFILFWHLTNFDSREPFTNKSYFFPNSLSCTLICMVQIESVVLFIYSFNFFPDFFKHIVFFRITSILFLPIKSQKNSFCAFFLKIHYQSHWNINKQSINWHFDRMVSFPICPYDLIKGLFVGGLWVDWRAHHSGLHCTAEKKVKTEKHTHNLALDVKGEKVEP